MKKLVLIITLCISSFGFAQQELKLDVANALIIKRDIKLLIYVNTAFTMTKTHFMFIRNRRKNHAIETARAFRKACLQTRQQNHPRDR